MDVVTILYVYAITNVLLGAFFAFFKGDRAQQETVRLYATSKIIEAAALLLVALRDQIPDVMSIQLGNFLAMIGVALEIFTLVSIRSGVNWRKLRTMLFLALGYGIFFVAISGISLNVRILVISLFFVVSYSYAAIQLLWFQKNSITEKAIGVVALVVAVSFALRLYQSLFLAEYTNPFSNNYLVVWSYLALLVITGFWPLLFVLVIKEQDQAKIQSLHDKMKNDVVELNELNATKDRFFSIIAHDLRGPIGSLTQLGEMLSGKFGEISETEQKELIDMVGESSKNTFTLLNNLLQWASSESGSLQLKQEGLDLNSVVEHAFQIHIGNLKRKSIQAINNVNPELVAWADLKMIQTVVRNLLSNGIKFSEENSKIIFSGKLANQKVQIDIQDTGVGIPKEAISVLFKLDSSHHTPGTRDEKGSGLGLKLCKQFVEKNGGEIWVESEVGVGSTFHFTLPQFKDQ